MEFRQIYKKETLLMITEINKFYKALEKIMNGEAVYENRFGNILDYRIENGIDFNE